MKYIFILIFLFSAINADVITFTDRAAFEAAAGTVVTEDFSGLNENFVGNAVDVGGFTAFTQAGGRGQIGFVGDNVNGTERLFVLTEINRFDLVLTFDSPIFAVGFDSAAWRDSGRIADLSFDNDDNDVVTLQSSAQRFEFFGFVSDTAFTTLTISQNAGGVLNDAFSIDNVTHTPTIPEPSTYIAFLLGLCMLGYFRKQK